MERSPGRVVAMVVVLFLLGILVGRLSLERTGVGLAFVPVVAVVAFALLASRVGWRVSLALVVAFLVMAAFARFVLFAHPSGWIGLLLLLVVAAVAPMAWNVVRQMRQA